MNERNEEFLLARRWLAEKATPGPWETDYRKAYVFTPVPEQIMIAEMRGAGDGLDNVQRQANASHIAANSPDVVMADIDEILRLRGEVERLEKEADWLAEQLSYSCFFTGEHNCGIPRPCPKDYGFRCIDVDAKEWREAARNAAEKRK